jgi:hypothetical protein
MGKAEDRAWLVTLGFTEAKADSLLGDAEIGDKFTSMREGHLRQADYDRKMNALKTDLDAKNEQLNKEIAEWAAAKADDSTEATALRTKAQETERQMLALRQKVEAAATERGLNPADFLLSSDGKVTPAKVDPQPAAAPDLRGYLKMDEAAPLFDYLINLPAELDTIQREHQQLYGTALDLRQINAEIRARAAKKLPIDARAIWEEKFNVAAKRDEVAKTRHDAEIKAAEDRGFQRATTEHALPGAQPVGQHSPVLTRQTGQESHLKRPESSTRVAAATAALATHRYRPDTPTAGGKT